jgi:small-conductance mechanosensitive channel
MKRSRHGIASAVIAGGLVAGWAYSVAAQVAAVSGAADSFLQVIAKRLELTISHFPALAAHLARLPELVGGGTASLLVGMIVAGLAVEYLVRWVLRGVRLRGFGRLAAGSALHGFWRAVLFDVIAVVAFWVAGRLVLGQIGGGGQSVGGKLGQILLMALIYWRVFNLVFLAWLRPNAAAGRIAPVDDATARSLLIGLNLMVVLPLSADKLGEMLLATGATADAVQVADFFYVGVIAVALMGVVWRWHREMAAWLTALVPEAGFARQLKLDIARNWWIGGVVFYGLTGMAELYGELTGNESAPRGLDVIEGALIALLLFETLMHRITRHIVSELPMAGDVVADCVRLAVRLFAVIVVVQALMVQVLAASTAADWAVHDRGAKIAALSAVAIYALWRFLRYRMDSYIASNPLPSADAPGETEDDAQVAASRLRTLMPLLRAVSGGVIAIIGTLLVLSELGVNITPLIAGASVLGLAVSFGSQSLVRDVVSGVFFLAEDSFRIGEYLDCSKVKGTVEGFSVRSLRLRHQNGQLHIVPFGQVGHITNFSRDWTVVKFTLAFAHGTDIELVRKTVKKMGLEMMEEPAFKSVLMQPLKMQGVVDIKDSTVIVRFKYMARPNNPGIVQRVAVRRMYDTFPGLGIQFAQATTFQMPTAFAPPPPPAPAPAPAPAAKAAE